MATDVNNSEELILKAVGIRITAVRLLIFRTIRNECSGIFNLAELEERLPTVDKSTIFRTLTVFQERHLLDIIDDGSGSQKYCVSSLDGSDANRRHVHFSCRKCHKTVCLTDVELPRVSLPEGYLAEDVEYVVKGVCPVCNGSDMS